MKTLYLHIGMPKTGTSYIQLFLGKNNELLKKQGFCYPDFRVRFPGIGPKRNAHFLIYIPKDDRGRRDRIREKEIEEACFSKIFELFETYPNMIISEEGIWNFDEEGKDKRFLENLKKRLEERGISLKIVAYLRRQDLYIQSAWAQFIKKGTLHMTLSTFLRSKNFKQKRLDYYERLESVARVCGKENILVRIYEKEQYQGTGSTIISDFLHTVGAEMDPEFVDVESQNISFLGIYLEVKRELNKIDGLVEENGYIQKLINRVMLESEDTRTISSGEFLSYQETMKFMEQFEESNRKVAEEYLGRSDGELFFQKIEKKEGKEAESKKKYDVSEYVDVFARMLEAQKKDMEELIEENKVLKEKVRGLSRSIPNRMVRKIKSMLKNG